MNKPQRTTTLTNPLIHADRLFPTDLATRTIARRLYAEVRDMHRTTVTCEVSTMEPAA